MRLSSIFGDNMVLQQDTPVPVWGWAEPAARITVTLAGQCVHGVADTQGKWRVTLAPLKAGGPFEMRVDGGDSSRVLANVLVGEVWVASGQSNMEMPVYRGDNAEQEIFGATFDGIRLFTVAPAAVVDAPQEVEGNWSVCSPKTAGTFSAAAYFFGRELHRKLGVPVGLINSSKGGTPAESWTSREGLLSLPSFKETVERYERNLVNFERDTAEYKAKVKEEEAKYYPADPANLGFEKGWASPDTDLGDWDLMPVPSYWQTKGLDFNGVLWFRRDVEIPAEWAGKELR